MANQAVQRALVGARWSRLHSFPMGRLVVRDDHHAMICVVIGVRAVRSACDGQQRDQGCGDAGTPPPE
jgi:hypothetical protein